MLVQVLAEQWWTASEGGLVGGIGGSALGLLGGVIGAAGGVLAPRGKCRGLVLGTMAAVAVLSGVVAVVGVVAIVVGQPYHVWYPLLLGGGLGAGLFGGLMPVVSARYRQAEARRMESEELRGGL